MGVVFGDEITEWYEEIPMVRVEFPSGWGLFIKSCKIETETPVLYSNIQNMYVINDKGKVVSEIFWDSTPGAECAWIGLMVDDKTIDLE